MKTRNELAEAILLARCAVAPIHEMGSKALAETAFADADAFLAAAVPTQPASSEQREPDAVWTLDDDGNTNCAEGKSWMREAKKLLAGRERVRLRVYVEEVE